MITSVTYNFIRSRQLEGTFPGDRTEGVWPITVQRVSRGLGAPEEQDWPRMTQRDEWPPSEPPGLNAKARSNRVHHYQRVRSARECPRVLSSAGALGAAFEITEQWFDAPKGIIEMPEADTPVIGSHCVCFLPQRLEGTGFVFMNSWGEEWGNRGLGALSPEFFDRYLIEAWAPFGDGLFPCYFEGRGVTDLAWGMPDYLGGALHGREIFDATHDERIAWTFAVCRDRFLDVEELFVMPSHRQKGYANRLVDMLRELAEKLGLNIRLWVPFADCEPDNLPGLEKIASRLGVELMPSGVRWAALKAVAHPQLSQIILPSKSGGNDERAAELLSKVSMPQRPAQVRPIASALGVAAVAASVAMPDFDVQQPKGTADVRVTAAQNDTSDRISNDEFECSAQKSLQKYAPLYSHLASEPTDPVSEQSDRVIPDDVFAASAEKAFEKYSELYERLS